MSIKNFKTGQKINHKIYGSGTVITVYENENKPQDEGVLIGNLTEKGISLLNQDRQVKNMPVDSTQILKRVFENDLSLLTI